MQAPNPSSSWSLAWLWPHAMCLGGGGSRAAAASALCLGLSHPVFLLKQAPG